MRAGKLDKYVELQNYTEAPDATGHGVKTWATYDSVWAHLRTLSGNERIAAQQVKAIQTHEITIRYRSDVQVNHRVVYGSRIWDIKDVRDIDEQNREIRMRCVEIPTQGPSASPSPSSSVSASPSSSVSSSPSSSPSASPSSSPS